MLTVRFPNGHVVTYNNATYLTHSADVWHLYADRDQKTWIASIQGSAGVIVGCVAPCKVEHPRTTPIDMMNYLLDHGREFNWRELEKLAEVKAMLDQFNRQRRTWRKK